MVVFSKGFWNRKRKIEMWAILTRDSRQQGSGTQTFTCSCFWAAKYRPPSTPTEVPCPGGPAHGSGGHTERRDHPDSETTRAATVWRPHLRQHDYGACFWAPRILGWAPTLGIPKGVECVFVFCQPTRAASLFTAAAVSSLLRPPSLSLTQPSRPFGHQS